MEKFCPGFSWKNSVLVFHGKILSFKIAMSGWLGGLVASSEVYCLVNLSQSDLLPLLFSRKNRSMRHFSCT